MAKIVFIEDRCKSCKLCTTVCPKNILFMDSKKLNKRGFNPVAVSDMDKCTGCGFCVTICPDCAIEVEK